MLHKLLKSGILCCLLLSLLALPQAAWPDGESRPATQAEKDFHLRVLNTLAKAVPGAGPSGWELVDQTNIAALERVGVDSEEYPFRVDYFIEWQDTARIQESDKRQMDAGSASLDQSMASGPTDLQKKYDDLVKEFGQAIEKNDMAEAQRLSAQMEEVAAKLNTAYAAQDQQFNEALASVEAHDVKMKVAVHVNDMNRSFYADFTEEPSVQGGLTVRTAAEQTEHYGWKEGETWVLLGPWKRGQDGSDFEATPKAGTPHVAVQTIAVKVEADKARADAFIRSIDWAALKGLLKN